MKDFAETFFTHFGAMVQPHPDFPNELIVDLPPNLVEIFGKPRLYLVFPHPNSDPPDLSPNEDLVVYGSRIFEKMMGLLQTEGEVMHLHLPQRVSNPPTDFPFSPVNCQVQSHQVEVKAEQFFIVNFRAIFASDERREEVVTLVLDESGTSRPNLIPTLTDLSDIEPDLPAVDLPPAQCRQMVQRAESLVQEEIAGQVAALQAEIQARLQRSVLRLESYYRRLMAEIRTADESEAAKIQADLERDLARKVADDVERYRLRVSLTPLSYAVVDLPLVYHQATLTTDHSSQPRTLLYNLHTDQPNIIPCDYCGDPLERFLALCDRGHIVHAACFERCRHCDRDICHRCGIQPCAISDVLVCVDCVAPCGHCQRWIAGQEIETCAICSTPHCPEHRFTCRWCEQSYCQACHAAGICHTCRRAVLQPSVAPQTAPALPDLNPDRYRWSWAENQQCRVYWGTPGGPFAALSSQIFLVVDLSGQTLRQERITAWQRWFGSADLPGRV